MSLSLLLSRPLSRALSRPLSRHGGAVADPVALLLHWSFEEGAGTTIGATEGVGGSISGDQWVDGIVGDGAVDLDGIEGLTDSPAVFGADVLTIAFWLLADNVSGGSLIQCPSASDPYFVAEFDSNNLAASIFGSAGQLKEEAAFSAHAGKWTHVALVLDNSTGAGDIKIYINGALQSDNKTVATKVNTANFATDTVKIGESFLPQFDGAMDDLRIYGSELTQSQIHALVALCPAVELYEDGTPDLNEDETLNFYA